MIKVLFFAQLREQLRCGEVNLDQGNVQTVAQLLEHLILLHPHWSEFLANKKLLVAVNKVLVKGSQVLQSGDEVAFFPPVTGG